MQPTLSMPASRMKVCACIAIIILGTTALCLSPTVAHADIFGDILGIDNWLKELFCSMANSMFGFIFSILQSISATDLLVGSWQDLFGGGSNAVYRFATDICNGIVKPIAGSILAFVMLVQLIKISGRMDASATLPAVKDIVVLFVIFAVFNFLIGNADKLCEALYDAINHISIFISNYNPNWTLADGQLAFFSPDNIDNVSVGDVASLLIIGLITFLAAILAYVVALLMAYARAIQLYLYMTFSPIPLALMGFEDTRQMGIGFLKGFLAVCIAGCIMLFVIIAFPFIATSAIDLTGDAYSAIGITAILNCLKVLALCLLLVFALIKSGSTARDILGG